MTVGGGEKALAECHPIATLISAAPALQRRMVLKDSCGRGRERPTACRLLREHKQDTTTQRCKLNYNVVVVAVQLRMVLEDSYAALEDAKGNGVPITTGSETGVYVACISFEYATVLERGGFKVHNRITAFQFIY